MTTMERTTAPSGPEPLARLATLTAYRRKAMPACVDLRLDGNEGPPPPAELLDALHAAGLECLRAYPSTVALEADLARRHDVPPEQVLVTAGGDEALDRVFRAFCDTGRNVVLPDPSFEMLPRYAALAGCAVREVPWSDGPFPIDGYLSAADASTAAAFVVTPNNPTGAVATAADLAQLSRSLPNALIVLDHAYAEFGAADLTGAALELPNAIVVRTLSKAWGLAGLRVGYALGPARLIEALRTAGSPYTVPGPSIALARAALMAGDDRVSRCVARVRVERAQLAAMLRDHGFDVAASGGNFVLARGPRSEWLWAALRSLGIAVRRFAHRPGLTDALRITCPGEERWFVRLRAAIDAALAPEAVLFDLDGVLADVSGSYRVAIQQTAASFGVELSKDDVRAGKAAGDANNDWVLTQRLLAARGVDVPLAEVTARFERLYQGTAGRPGLCENEPFLVDRPTWTAWSERLPVGVVTGRPRADAERWLTKQGLRERCAALVCMEDGPLKPDPFPVRRALDLLGVTRAWYVGDTRDDLDAARACGVVPIGVVAPGEDAELASAHLLEHGAARVLGTTTELGEVLP